MLRELRIRNYAVIDDLTLELGPGLNVLTGETGAGKSIIVGALSLLLGERASAEVVRAGEDRALVEGSFDVTRHGAVAERLRAVGIQPEDGWLILRREVREGRSRAWVNGSPATAGLLGDLGAELVELHGQHEHQALLRREAQREILDAYAGEGELAAEVRRAHSELAALRRAIEETRRRAERTWERADDLRFRAEEIEKARLVPGEDERLAAEAKRLEHSEELRSLSASLHEAVYEGDASVVERVGDLRRPLENLGRIDSETAELGDLWETALRALEELGRRLGAYRESVDHEPRRLEAIRERLDLLFRLKSKYRGTLEEVIAAGRSAREALAALDSSETEIRALEKKESVARAAFLELAARLTAARQRAAARLGKEVAGVLPELGMVAGRFRVELEPLAEPGAAGAERVEFRIALNPGFEPAPLARVASGGELSRVMLAIKTVLAAVDRVPCLVFDEIDAGVGGEVAHRVAERLHSVAERHQVFVITHLPQIASRAREHLRVEKVERGGRVSARVARLAAAERVEEVARLLGGDPGSGVSRRHAEELLATGATAGADAAVVRRGRSGRADRSR
ncbi:MAG: DNA repair protein RecN [Gemmatimonadota bacterium]